MNLSIEGTPGKAELIVTPTIKELQESIIESR